jgi:hypothetical protein
MPDHSPDLKYNAAYSIQLANGDIEWWKDPGNKYLLNLIGSFEIK